jgi:hypothetical protein
MLPFGLDVDLESEQESVARPNNQLGPRARIRTVFCLRIDEDDFPSFIDDDHRVWRRLKQLTEREDFALHSKLRVPRHGAHTTPLYRVSPRLSRLPWTWRRYCLHPKCARGPCRW